VRLKEKEVNIDSRSQSELDGERDNTGDLEGYNKDVEERVIYATGA
jgi:hypothetical protein